MSGLTEQGIHRDKGRAEMAPKVSIQCRRLSSEIAPFRLLVCVTPKLLEDDIITQSKSYGKMFTNNINRQMTQKVFSQNFTVHATNIYQCLGPC